MKAKITNIKRFAVHDGDGIRTTVFFKGCPLACKWCHNPESMGYERQIGYQKDKCVNCLECTRLCEANVERELKHIFDRNKCVLCGKCEAVCPNGAFKLYGKEISVDELFEILIEDIDFYKSSGGGVTLSGGECLVQWEVCLELLKRLKEIGIHTAVDTCGYISQSVLKAIVPYTDVFLYDVKAIDKDVHIRCTDRDNQIILDNLEFLDKMGCKIEIRIPFVPEYNDGEMDKIAQFLGKLSNVTGIRLLRYHNLSKSRYNSLNMDYPAEEVRIPDREEILNARKQLEKSGFPVIDDVS